LVLQHFFIAVNPLWIWDLSSTGFNRAGLLVTVPPLIKLDWITPAIACLIASSITASSGHYPCNSTFFGVVPVYSIDEYNPLHP